jgi:hypothetical protein
MKAAIPVACSYLSFNTPTSLKFGSAAKIKTGVRLDSLTFSADLL